MSFELKLLIFDADCCAWRNGFGNKGVGTDHRLPADHRISAQHGSARIDGHIVLDGRVATLAPQALPAPGGQRAQGHALIQLYIFTDDRRFSHDDAGSVIDKEILSDGSTGVDIDTGHTVGVFGHNSGQHGYIKGVKHVGQTVHRDR